MRQTVAGRGARGRSKRGESAHSKGQARRATKRHPTGPGLASISPHVSRERPLPAQVTQGARRCPTAGRPPLARVTEGVRLYPTAAGRPSLAQVTGGVRLYPTAGRPSLAQITGGGGSGCNRHHVVPPWPRSQGGSGCTPQQQDVPPGPRSQEGSGCTLQQVVPPRLGHIGARGGRTNHPIHWCLCITAPSPPSLSPGLRGGVVPGPFCPPRGTYDAPASVRGPPTSWRGVGSPRGPEFSPATPPRRPPG